jgi:hypothetical protein
MRCATERGRVAASRLCSSRVGAGGYAPVTASARHEVTLTGEGTCNAPVFIF